MVSTAPPTILFVIAMEREAAPLKVQLNLKKDPLFESHPIVDSWIGTFEGMQIVLVLTKPDPKFKCDSIGPETAAVITYAAVEAYKPHLIISAGTAGAFEKEKGKGNVLNLGDVCYAKENGVSFIDREIILDDFKQYMEGKYDVAKFDEIFSKLGFKETAIGTTSSFYDYCKDYSYNKKVDVQEMEAASVGKMAYLLKVPFMALKVISNVEYEEKNNECGAQFWPELDSVSDHIAKKTVELLKEFSQIDLRKIQTQA